MDNISDKQLNAVMDFRNVEDYTLDTIVQEIGAFGKYQIVVLMLIGLPMAFNAIVSVAYIFTAHPLTYRCNISECDDGISQYDEPWTTFTIPIRDNTLDKCYRYLYKNSCINADINSSNSLSVNTTEHLLITAEDKCREDCFRFSRYIQKCPNQAYIFRDNEVTISKDFNIYCENEWQLSLIGTFNNFGQFVGIPIGGYISDKCGRRNTLVVSSVLSAAIGILRSYSTSYTEFAIYEIFDNICSSALYGICFIIGIELMDAKRRVFACCLITIFYAIGEMFLAILAKYIQNWRILLRVTYIPALALLLYLWLLPESIRWLLSQQREKDVRSVLKRIAAVNRRQLADGLIDKLILANREKQQLAVDLSESRFPLKIAFQMFFGRITNCSFCWMVNVFVYYGLSLNAVQLNGDKHNNFIFIALVEIPGLLLPLLTMDTFGRRYSLFSYMLISGICCLTIVFVPTNMNYIRLLLFLIGKMSITASFQILYFFTSEIFPTSLRNTLLSFCSMVGRIGSMLAPLTPLLAKYHNTIPAMLFALSAICSAFGSLCFPETNNLTLPNTLQEADDIGTGHSKYPTIRKCLKFRKSTKSTHSLKHSV